MGMIKGGLYMITCPNCGAKIEEEVTKCPYCGYINIKGAEKKYNEDIEKIKTDIEEEKKEPGKALKKGFFSGFKSVFVSVTALLILLSIFLVLLLYELRDKPSMFRSGKQEAEAAAYRAVATEKIAEAYDNKNIEQLAEIFDKAYSEDRVILWGDPHYDAAQAASNYMKLQRCMPNLLNEKTTKRQAEEITYYCFYFYYRAYREDGAEIFDPIREDEIIPIIQTRLGFSIEDMENFRGDVMTDSGIVNRTNVHRVTKKYYKEYR